MRRALLAAVAVLSLTAPARADLQLCNKTSYVLDLALALEEKDAAATRDHVTTAMLQGMLGSEALAERGPGETLSRINRQLTARAVESRFATLVYAVLSVDGRVVFANAGHNAPAIVGRGVRRLAATGPILGVFADAAFPEETAELRDGETLVMFTDGVTEARNRDDEEFGEDRLLACLTSEPASAPDVMLARIFAAVRDFSHAAEQADDITVTATRRRGSSA